MSSTKKVFLNGRFLTQSITGVQRTAYEMVLALDQLLEEEIIPKKVYKFTLIYSGTLVNPIKLRNIKLQKKGYLTGNLWEQLELPFYTFGDLLISMCTISSILKRKQIVFIHDASFIVNPSFFNFIFRTWYRVAITLLGKISKRIVTVSNFSKSELIKYLKIPTSKIFVIYNSADHILRYAEPDASFRQKVKSLQPFVLAVSSQSANKNFDGLSKALKNIDFADFHMVIAGGSSTTLHQVIPDPSINYLGYVTNDQLKYLYANASLFIFPSFYEGFGIPPLEAMISGCAVIASDTSSLPEVLGDACCYFDPYSIKNIAEKIVEIINDKEKVQQLKEKGLERAALYSWLQSAKELFNMINSI